MGVVINKSLQITLENLLQHLDIQVVSQKAKELPVLAGGPVDPEKGFVIHNQLAAEAENDEQVAISASKEMLRDISTGKGPEHFIVVLGYAGWEAGQLEKEINRNDWLVAPVDKAVLFSTPLERRWEKAVKSIGIDINHLSGHVGHA